MESLQASVTVNAPIEQCYEVWNHFEGFPNFMKTLKKVKPQAETNLWHWQMADTQGNSIEWEIRILEQIPFRKISWQSPLQAPLQSFGEVQFTRITDTQTGITLKLGFEPKIFRLVSIPREGLAQETLHAFKWLLEGQAVKVGSTEEFGYGPFSEAGEPDLTGEQPIRECKGPGGPII